MAKGFLSEEFDDCVSKGRIKKFPAARSLAAKEMKAAEDDLAVASESLKKGQAKWATVQAYYAMFHAARALIYSKGYREHSHYCLVIAVKALFVAERLLDVELVEELQLAKTLRENADYDNEFSKASAQSLLKKAQQWVERSKKILLVKS